MIQAPQNAAKESEDAARIATRQGQPAQQEMEIVPVCPLHGRRRIVGREHCFFDDAGEEIDVASGGWMVVGSGWFPGPQKRGITTPRTKTCPWGPRMCGTPFLGRARNARAEFVKAHGDGLAEVHRRLLRVSRNDGEDVAAREIFLCEAPLFRAEDEAYAAAASELFLDERRQFRQRNDRLLGLAMLERAGANDQRAVGYRIREALRAFGVLEETFGMDGGLGFAPICFKGSDNGEAREAEVGHGSRRRSYIEGVARRDEDDFNAVALVLGEQDAILLQIHGDDGGLADAQPRGN